MKIAFLTLGCKANQYDTQAMETMAQAAGMELTDFDAAWDACVINTCTVTAVSDKKSRQVIRRARREHPDGILGVCGCFSQMSPALAAELGADVVGGSGQREAFFHALLSALETRQKACTVTPHTRDEGFECLPAGGLAGRTRAMLKIEEGCDNYCTYCIIPYSRGHIRSMPMEEAVRQTAALAEAGYRETVLTGIEISSYGRDLPGSPRLIDLLEAISPAAGSMRLHLGSLEPRTVDADFARRASALPNLCPHFHLSLQSGCDATLARMRRKYDTARFLESVQLLREAFPNCLISTDLITGFPGETEAEFAETLAFLRECAFGQMHIFPYSQRSGTPAEKMPQVPMEVREARAARAAKVADEMEQAFLQAQIGKTLELLPETCENGIWHGHSANYLEIHAAGNLTRGEFAQVRIVSAEGGVLRGEV